MLLEFVPVERGVSQSELQWEIGEVTLCSVQVKPGPLACEDGTLTTEAHSQPPISLLLNQLQCYSLCFNSSSVLNVFSLFNPQFSSLPICG